VTIAPEPIINWPENVFAPESKRLPPLTFNAAAPGTAVPLTMPVRTELAPLSVNARVPSDVLPVTVRAELIVRSCTQVDAVYARQCEAIRTSDRHKAAGAGHSHGAPRQVRTQECRVGSRYCGIPKCHVRGSWNNTSDPARAQVEIICVVSFNDLGAGFETSCKASSNKRSNAGR
jgi:hypothetical protein